MKLAKVIHLFKTGDNGYFLIIDLYDYFHNTQQLSRKCLTKYSIHS